MNGTSSPPSPSSKEVEEQVAKLQVSESIVTEQQKPHMSRHVMADDISTGSESSDEHNDDNVPRQELELVINALQTTVQKTTSDQPEASSFQANNDHGENIHHSADELHSGDDFQESSSSTSSEYDYSAHQQQQQQQQNQANFKTDDIVPPTPGSPPPNFEPPTRSSTEEDMPDVESFSANLIALHDINLKEIKTNNLNPREQEKKGR